MSSFKLPARRTTNRLAVALLATAALTLATSAGASAAAPVKLVPTGNITNGFFRPTSVAVNNDPASPDYGDVYVADAGNHRVQQFTAAGTFVAMLGWEVNATKDAEPTATQAEKNICTTASNDTCTTGVEGNMPGQMGQRVKSIAVDPSSGNLYLAENFGVAEGDGYRVQELTPEGRFVLEIGQEVNATHKTNLCTEEEVEKAGVTCAAPTKLGAGGDGSFARLEGNGNLLAVGGPEDLVYVGDEGRVQEFKTDGEWAGEIPLHGAPDIQALAVDDVTGDVYVLYANQIVVRELDPEGVELASFQVSPREEQEGLGDLDGMALSSTGDLAVVAYEGVGRSVKPVFGSLYDAATGRLVTEFTVPQGAFVYGMAFSDDGDAYGISETLGVATSILAYASDPVAELLATPGSCKPAPERDTSATFDCALNGEANPEGVSETEVLFQWGTNRQLGQATSVQPLTETKPVSATIEARPDQTFYYRLEGHDEHVKAPEKLTSETASLVSPVVPPRVLGVPSTAFATPSSVVLLGEVNPENTGTAYRFQYGACETLEHCAGMAETPAGESSAYGRIGVTLEARGLRPGTTYHDRLVAVNAHGEAALDATGGTAIPEGTFTTEPAPAPTAVSGAASAVGASTATISGSVEPAGEPASYSFELGLYEGAATQYGVVSSGSVAASTTPVEESLQLTGLQPGSTYAFRIAVHSGYIANATATLTGTPVLFTTAGLPAVLSVPTPPAQLAIPSIAFPPTTVVSPKTTVVPSKKKTKKRKAKKRKARPKAGTLRRRRSA
jgi:NHL repeat